MCYFSELLHTKDTGQKHAKKTATNLLCHILGIHQGSYMVGKT